MPTRPPVQSVVPIAIDIDIIIEPEPDQTTTAVTVTVTADAAAAECEVVVSEMSKSNYYGHETPAAPSSSSLQQQRSPKSHEEFDNDVYLLSDNDHIIPFNLNPKQRLRLLLHDENNDNDTTFLEEVVDEEGTEVMNGVAPVDVSRLLLDYSVLSTDNNGSIVAILHDEQQQQLHQPQPSPKTQQMKSSGDNNNNNNEENNTQQKVNKTKKKKDSSWVAMIEFIAPFHEGFGCADASDDNDDGGVQESPSRTPCKKQQSGQQLSENDKRGSDNNVSHRHEQKNDTTRRSNSTIDMSPSRHRNNQAASASCGLIDIEEAIANLIAPFYTIEDGVSQELEGIISCGMD
jgi:hypothetical protein